jgi:predicted secreted protein
MRERVATFAALAGVLLFGIGGAAPAAADEPPLTFERVSFSVERSADAENDRVRAVLVAQREGGRPAELADEVNRTMERALEAVRGAAGVTGKTSGYSTYQTSTPQRELVWVVAQELELEAKTKEIDGLRALLATLQADLQLRSMEFTPSDAVRRAAEDALVRDALTAFRARADLVRESLGFTGYRIVELQVGTGAPPPQPYARGGMVAMAESVAAPAVEAGTSSVGVSVSGTIQLEPAP